LTPEPERHPLHLTGVIFLIALGVRTVASARALVVPRDSVVLLDLARAFFDGNAAEALSHHQHPLFPWLTALVARSGLNIETAGTLVAVTAGALAVIPLLDIARRLVGSHTALLVGIVYALSPYPVRFAAVPLTDSTHLLFVLLGISLGLRAMTGDRAWPSALASGIAIGLAYLTRPEGLAPALVILPALALVRRGRARLIAPALALAGLVIVAAPYVSRLTEERGSFSISGKWKSGGQAKADEWSKITGHGRPSLPEAALETGRELAMTLHPALALLALIGLVRRGRPGARAIVTAAIILLYLAACVRLHWLRSYLSHRHVLVPSVLLLPLAGRGIAMIGKHVATRLRNPATTAAALLTVVVVSIMGPKTFALQGEDKIHLIDGGQEIAAASELPSGPLALRADARIAYYGGRSIRILPARLGTLEDGPSDEIDAWLKANAALLYLTDLQAEGPRWNAASTRLHRLPSGAAVYTSGSTPQR
jgi:Dolichyl-phosphate-mannose-protein mannosyltransferase